MSRDYGVTLSISQVTDARARVTSAFMMLGAGFWERVRPGGEGIK